MISAELLTFQFLIKVWRLVFSVFWTSSYILLQFSEVLLSFSVATSLTIFLAVVSSFVGLSLAGLVSTESLTFHFLIKAWTWLSIQKCQYSTGWRMQGSAGSPEPQRPLALTMFLQANESQMRMVTFSCHSTPFLFTYMHVSRSKSSRYVKVIWEVYIVIMF